MKKTVRRMACLGLILLPLAAFADDERYTMRNVPESYTSACASCHMGYQPGLLPAKAWQRMMSGLEQHYGTAVKLTPETVREIGKWLADNASRGRRNNVSPPEERITRTRWFMREHRHVSPPVWKLPSVKSPSNCQSCHAYAVQGSYDDDELLIPEGVTPVQMRAFLD